MAIFRICFGIYWLILWLTWFPNVALSFSSEGMHFPRFQEPLYCRDSVEQLLAWLTQGVSAGWAWTFYATTIVSLVLVTFGLFTRAATAVFFLSFVYHYYLSLHMFGASFHKLLLITSGVLVFSPCGQALSIDAWRARRRGRPMDSPVSLVTQRIICFQVAILYLGTGAFKLVVPAWSSGAVLKSALMGEYGTSLGHWLTRQSFMTDGVFDAAVLMVVAVELLMPVALYLRITQKWAFLVGAGFHIFNGTFLDLPEFYIMILAYPLFLPPTEVKSGVQRALGRLGLASSSITESPCDDNGWEKAQDQLTVPEMSGVPLRSRNVRAHLPPFPKSRI